MAPLSISLVVSPDGAVSARSWRDGTGKTGRQQVDLTGLDGRVLRVFERWLMEHDRVWDREDVRVFGQLLHRRLFGGEVWEWIEQQIRNRGDEVVRLQLAFPADAASSRLAALPWEYLCTPDRAGGHDGQFLVLMRGLLLSRSVPPGTPARAEVGMEQVRILPVVGEAHSDQLGPVDYADMLDAIEALGARPDVAVLEAAIEVPLGELVELVATHRPHVLHYMGHGRFTPETGKGALALRTEGGGAEWIDEDRLAAGLCTDEWTPTIVVLHACEGGRNDYDYRHAGLAPGLVRQGVQCVVAMQYPVTNETAIRFSTALYEALTDHQFLDEAVQTARRSIWQATGDARLLGVPMIYQRDAAPLLWGRALEAGD